MRLSPCQMRRKLWLPRGQCASDWIAQSDTRGVDLVLRPWPSQETLLSSLHLSANSLLPASQVRPWFCCQPPTAHYHICPPLASQTLGPGGPAGSRLHANSVTLNLLPTCAEGRNVRNAVLNGVDSEVLSGDTSRSTGPGIRRCVQHPGIFHLYMATMSLPGNRASCERGVKGRRDSYYGFS
jgi:hypothetical protein